MKGQGLTCGNYMSLTAITWNASLGGKKDLLRLCAIECVKEWMLETVGLNDMPVKYLCPSRQVCFSTRPLLTFWSMPRTTRLTFLHLVIPWGDFHLMVRLMMKQVTSDPDLTTLTLPFGSVSALCHLYTPVLLCCFQTLHCVYLRKQIGPCLKP